MLGIILNTSADTDSFNPHKNSVKDYYYLQNTDLKTAEVK